ncbi:mechanosensitive ion channel family protein [Sinobacterium caligoides]|nr:mechanosensitive ion channel family protein [Sinobacterium caligoides]
MARILIRRLQAQLLKNNRQWDDLLLSAMRGPTSAFIWLFVGSWTAQRLLPAVNDEELQPLIMFKDIAFICILAWLLVRFVRLAETLFESRGGLINLDAAAIHTIGKLLRIIIVLIVVLICIQRLGYSISGILAVGSIGGIAISFAAKDLLANFFGGLMVYLDRPFAIGDWVRSPDTEMEGTVEHIGWRTTRIRTFDQRPLYVPNSVFANVAVENPSRMLNRRIYETVGVRYNDIKALEFIVRDVRQMLENHPDIDMRKTLIVNFNSFGASSLDFFVYTFTKTTNWVLFHEIKQDVLLKIAAIIEQHGADIAYPTTTLKLEDIVTAASEEAES